jgi:hypothetical protein
MPIYRAIICKLRLNPEEAALFKSKAERYGNMSAMVRDAVAQFDDKATLGRIEALNAMTALCQKYQHELSAMGGNLNQLTKRANQMMLTGELRQEYFEHTVLPMVSHLQSLLQDFKDEQHAIARLLIRK